MLVPQCNIVFAYDDVNNTKVLELDFVNEIEINKSRKTLTNSCTITLPRNIRVLNNRNLNEVFRRGARVTVKLGYAPELKTEFTGYIAKVDAKIPFMIYCEDEMWQLKQNTISKAYKTVKLKELISFIYKGPARVADLELGGFVIKQQSTAQVLDALKKFGLQAYFDSDGVLVVDFAGSLNQKPIEVKYDFNVNIIDNDLEYVTKQDLRLKVKGVSKFPNGNKIEVFVGDKDGEERTLNYFNLAKAELEKIVKKELDKLKQDGYKNGFKTFGIPYAEPGYIAILNDIEYPERNGSYLMDAVKITFGQGGFRREIQLERKLA